MAALHFRLGQEEYRLGFRYDEEVTAKQGTLHTHNRVITYTDTRTQHIVFALLLKKVAGPWVEEGTAPGEPQRDKREYHWEAVLVTSTKCNLKDTYDKRRGREIALGRLYKIAPTEMQPLIMDAYVARLSPPVVPLPTREPEQ